MLADIDLPPVCCKHPLAASAWVSMRMKIFAGMFLEIDVLINSIAGRNRCC